MANERQRLRTIEKSNRESTTIVNHQKRSWLRWRWSHVRAPGTFQEIAAPVSRTTTTKTTTFGDGGKFSTILVPAQHTKCGFLPHCRDSLFLTLDYGLQIKCRFLFLCALSQVNVVNGSVVLAVCCLYFFFYLLYVFPQRDLFPLASTTVSSIPSFILAASNRLVSKFIHTLLFRSQSSRETFHTSIFVNGCDWLVYLSCSDGL